MLTEREKIVIISFFFFSAFFPLLVILHFVQLFFYSILISQPWFFATFFGNSLWLVALGYYLYITFLGYHSLHILDKTKVFLYPFGPLVLIYLASLVINWNITQSLMFFYHYRVLWVVIFKSPLKITNKKHLSWFFFFSSIQKGFIGLCKHSFFCWFLR